MLLHANAKLGLAGRLALVRAIEDGLSLKAAAAAFSVSPATAHRWWHRWLEGDRRPEALLDRSSRPKHSPRLLAAELQERICACRRETGWGPRPASRTRRSGRCFAGRGSRGGRRRPKSRPTGTSGPAPAICCTWTPAVTHASCGLVTASLATARNAPATGRTRRPGSATTTRTRSSTTIRGWLTSSSTTTRKPRR